MANDRGETVVLLCSGSGTGSADRIWDVVWPPTPGGAQKPRGEMQALPRHIGHAELRRKRLRKVTFATGGGILIYIYIRVCTLMITPLRSRGRGKSSIGPVARGQAAPQSHCAERSHRNVEPLIHPLHPLHPHRRRRWNLRTARCRRTSQCSSNTSRYITQNPSQRWKVHALGRRRGTGKAATGFIDRACATT